MTGYIKCLLDEKYYVISIFIDLKKAFITKYYCKNGNVGALRDLLRSYFTNRCHYTVVKFVNSELRTVSCITEFCVRTLVFPFVY